MDQEEIARLCASLSLQNKDETLWSVRETLKDSAGRKLDLCLVGKVLTNKHVNREAFRTVMPKIWQTTLDVEVVQDNTFLFYFRNQGDRFWILSGGPWTFDNCLLVLEKPSGVRDIISLAFNRVAFWLQIPNAPLLCMTKEMGEFIGHLIGELRDIDVGITGECFGKYMRLKVAVDVSKPLKRFLRLELEKGKESILLLRYEKLPEYCFHCGIIGHSYQDCGQRRGEDIGGSKDFEYGPWMRASDPPGRNNVTGSYRLRGEGSKSGFGGARFHNGGHSRKEESWRSRRVSVNSPVYPTEEREGSAQDTGAAGAVSDQTVKGGVGTLQGTTVAAVIINGDNNMQVETLNCTHNVKNSVGLHAEVANVGRGLGDEVGASHIIASGTVEESVGLIKKGKGKWKRWAREGGVRGRGSDEVFRGGEERGC
ncbi:hypothetical protein EZV62_008162 [Acer yangbiense]|uniref:CCHC-type domain-containing protein n=1 Tax=Acer yangbiense TaxID=1000413 RepID=A0A5C7ICE5_9ROSI|nr:hypothetical protein EZV62_008162 [Acer yangbiense]